MKTKFIKESFFSIPKSELFAFHERKDAFNLLTPEFAKVESLTTASTLKPSDDVVRFNALFLFLKFQFEMIHTEYVKDQLFVDEQKKGLFSAWRHEHHFLQAGWKEDPFSMLRDEIRFSHPLLFLFRIFVKSRLKMLFKYRHKITGEMLHQPEKQDKRIVVTGATGLIGQRVCRILMEKGYQVLAFVRDGEKAKQILGSGVEIVYWDLNHPEKGMWKEMIKKAHGVIHLAGYPLFKKRWNQSIKDQIWNSRIDSTRALVNQLRESEVFITASAVGLYGANVNDVADEDHQEADDFLARLCVEWEKEAMKAPIRNVQLRIGIVLSRQGGALKEMLPMFRLGAGGPMGNPNGWVNWIHIEDMARLVVMALENKKMKGPYNAAGPQPVTMGDFARSIARNMKRPCLMRYPVPLLKLIIGEAGQYMAGSPRVLCNRILDQDYTFMFQDIDAAIGNLLN